ncbi:MAG TPA: PorV/PorQ family protein [Rhodothermales bacterium]|nr:PorV/PorQ family protein [Rhodothermales bacterium]
MSSIGSVVGLSAAITVFSVANLPAQSRAGTTAAPFLTLGTGARSQGVGQAYTALASGGDALFWNPASGARPYMGEHRSSAFFTHYNWFADIDYNAAGVVVPVTRSGIIGLSIASVDYGRMDVRTVDLPEGNGETFTSSDYSFGLTYAQPLTSSFYFGGTAKYVRQHIQDMHAQTMAFDFGFYLETQYFRGLRIAASIQNFGGKLQMDGVNSVVFVDVDEDNSGSNSNIPARLEMNSWDLPLSFRFGLAFPVYQSDNVELLGLADANQTNDQNLNGDVGGQLNYTTKTFSLSLRAGYKDLFLDEEDVDSNFSYGGGLDVKIDRIRLGFDYAYVPFDLLGDTNMFDVRISY